MAFSSLLNNNRARRNRTPLGGCNIPLERKPNQEVVFSGKIDCSHRGIRDFINIDYCDDSFFLILGNNNGNHRLFLHLLFLTYYFVHCLTTSLFFSFVVFFIRQSSSISSDFLNVDWTARSFFRFTMIIFHFFSFSCSFGFFPSLSTISPLACLQCVCMCLVTLVQSAHMHTPWYAEKLISGTGVYPNTVE